MFIGEYTFSLDTKGRLSVPAKFRADFQGSVIITRGLDQCLLVYPRQEWQILAEKISSLPINQKQNRAFARLMLAGAWDTDIDSQGRIMIPEYLRTYAKLGKHAVVAGLYKHVEIWDEDAWQQYKSATEAQSEAIAEEIALL